MQINSRILSETCEVWLFHHGGFISLDSTANFQTYQIWLSLFVRQIQEYVIKHLHFNEFFHAHGSVIGNLYELVNSIIHKKITDVFGAYLSWSAVIPVT